MRQFYTITFMSAHLNSCLADARRITGYWSCNTHFLSFTAQQELFSWDLWKHVTNGKNLCYIIHKTLNVHKALAQKFLGCKSSTLSGAPSTIRGLYIFLSGYDADCRRRRERSVCKRMIISELTRLNLLSLTCKAYLSRYILKVLNVQFSIMYIIFQKKTCRH